MMDTPLASYAQHKHRTQIPTPDADTGLLARERMPTITTISMARTKACQRACCADARSKAQMTAREDKTMKQVVER
jgi:hypothetical protein